MLWLLLGALIVLAWLILLRGVRSETLKHHVEAVDPVAMHRQQCQELEQDEAAGLLSAEQVEQARAELDRALLNAAKTVDTVHEAEATASSKRLINGTTLLLLPLLAVALYLYLGQPHLAGSGAATQATAQGLESSEELPSIAEMITALEQRLAESPDDETALWLLSRTYVAEGRYQDALGAIKTLQTLVGDTPEVLLQHANILALLNDGEFDDTAVAMIEQVLALDSNNVGALWFAGLAAQQRENFSDSLRYWQRMRPLVVEDAEALAQLDNMLSVVQAIIDREQMGPAAATAPEVAVAGINSIVIELDISAELNADLAPGDSIYVLARGDDGLPMPVAVEYLEADALPLTVELNDEKSMLPNRKLSSFSRVTVLARVSRSGSPLAQSGDFTSEEVSVESDQQSLSLLIDRVVP